MQYDRNAKEPSGIDPVQLNFVVKDGAFSMGVVRFNGKVSISETEVTAFVDNVMVRGLRKPSAHKSHRSGIDHEHHGQGAFSAGAEGHYWHVRGSSPVTSAVACLL
jgi:hypothetical protein